MADSVLIAGMSKMLVQPPMTREALQTFLVDLGMTKKGAVALVQTLPTSEGGRISMSSFVAFVNGEDVAYMVNNGIAQPSEADVAYFREQQMKGVMSSFLHATVRMKPVDVNCFAADYFSGALAEQKRLVLVSSDVGEVDLLTKAVKPMGNMGAQIVTAVWPFEACPEDLLQLVADLVAKHGTFKTIAMCCHDGGGSEEIEVSEEKQKHWEKVQWEAAGKPVKENGEMDWDSVAKFMDKNGAVRSDIPDKWYILESHGVDLAEGIEDPGVEAVIKALAEAASVRVDILACSLASTDKGRAKLQAWEKETNTNFAASTDITGNAEQGGNWVLETDGIDLCDVYFDATKLQNWQVTLGKGKYPCRLCPNRTNYNSRICGSCKKKVPQGNWSDSADGIRFQGPEGQLKAKLRGCEAGSCYLSWIDASVTDSLSNDDGQFVNNKTGARGQRVKLSPRRS